MARVLVAGATGYLGGHLVRELGRRGWTVRALARPGKAVPEAAEVVHAQVTDPATLRGVCDDVDAVFSALGITRQTDDVTYEDIEYTANLHLLEEAARAGVRRFGVVSVAHPEIFDDLAICGARERFVAHLLGQQEVSGFVVRGTGFFNDLTEVFEMAQRGRVYLVGDGSTRINPVHGADVASAAADGLHNDTCEISVGGPRTYTWNEVASLAFEMLSQKPRITHVPSWVAAGVLAVAKPLHRRTYDVGSFIVRGATNDVVAPNTGVHDLATFYRELAAGTSSP